MEIFQSFVLDGSDYRLNVHWEQGQPFFKATEIGNILGLKQSLDKTFNELDSDEKILLKVGDHEALYITEAGLYRLLMFSRKPMMRPFQMWIIRIISSIRKKGKYELEKYKEELHSVNSEFVALDNNLKILQKEVRSSKHQYYVESFANKPIVYFGRIDINDDKYLVNIGSTEDIQAKNRDLCKEFGNFQIFKVVECDSCDRFVHFLHTHKDIHKSVYKGDVYEERLLQDVFKLNDVEVKKAINIAQQNAHKFKRITVDVTALEIKSDKHPSQEVQHINETIPQDNIVSDPDYIDPVLLFADNRKCAHYKGSKIQRYSPDGKTLLETYESAIIALRDNKLDSPSRSRINDAVKSNKVYKDYRWAFLDRSLPNDTFQELNETVYDVIDIRKGFVAMLNLDQDKIVKVFRHQKDAGIDRKFKSSAAVCSSIKKGTQSGGHYFKMWFDCSKDLQNEYLSRDKLPEKYVCGGQRVQQLHPINENVIKVYSSITEVTKDFALSRKSLSNAIENGFILKGYKWSMEK